jgi:hypothetical protein
LVKIQLELKDKENEIIEVFKIRNKLKTKQQAIQKFIQDKGGEYL